MADEGLRPPFGPPPGPRVDDATVVRCFAWDDPCGHSTLLYAEGPLLEADGDQPIAIRVAQGTVLLRIDVPPDLEETRVIVGDGFAAAGLRLIDEDTLWGVPVALQLAGLRLSSWDLWGVDIDVAFAAVRALAIGDSGTVIE